MLQLELCFWEGVKAVLANCTSLKFLLAPSKTTALHPLVHRPFEGGPLCFVSVAGKWKFCGFYFYYSIQQFFNKHICAKKAQIT